MKIEFSKKLLIVDYLIFAVLIVLYIVFGDSIDLSMVVVGWIAQLGISSVAYYWKAKTDNRVKIPFKVVESLSPEMQDKIDLTQIITSIIQSE